MRINNILKVIIVLLIIFNIICVYFLMKNNVTIDLLVDKIELLTNTYKPLSLTNKRFNSKYISGNKVNIAFIFSDNGCKDCINELINKINRIDLRFNHQIKIFYLGKNPNLINLNLLTKNFTNTSSENLFGDSIEIVQPLGLLIKDDGIIIDSQEEIVASPNFMKNFIDRSLKILEIL